MKLKGKDLLLLLLYSPGISDEYCEPIEGRTRLTKMVFLFDKEIKKHFKKGGDVELPDFGFVKWKYGPMSKQIFEDIEFLETIGFVDTGEATDASAIGEESDEYLEYEEADQIGNVAEGFSEYTICSFRLSDLGKKYIENKAGLYDQLSEKQKDILQEFKARLNSASLRAILRYVYKRYPEMAQKSEIKDKVLS